MFIDWIQWCCTVIFLAALAICGRKVAPRKHGGGCAYQLAEHGYLTLREREVVLRAVRSGMNAGCTREEIKALALATLSLVREQVALCARAEELR